MKRLFFSFLLLCGFIFSSTVYAQSFSIVATVNGEVISNFALHNRITLIINSSGLTNTPEIRDKLLPQAIQSLINEKLQMQDAEKQGIKITDEEMKRAISELEKKNNLEPGKFDEFLASQNLTKEPLMEQIKSQMVWKKILSRQIQPKVVVSDYEVNDTIKWLSSKRIKEEVYLSEIFISIIDEKEKESHDLSQKLVDEIRKGASFSSIAEQFSSAPTASKGGTLGWVAKEQMNDTLQNVIEATKSNEITDPIRTENGFYILKVGNRRNTNPTPSEERVREMLTLQKIELESRSYMKNLRRDAFVEIRL